MSAKFILLVLSIVLLLTVGGYRAYAIFHPSQPAPRPVQTTHASEKPTAHSATSPAALPRGPYDLKTECFLGMIPGVLRTTEREYRSGEMSSLGLCIAIQGKVAKIQQPEGRILYVVADLVHLEAAKSPPVAISPAPLPQPSPPVTVLSAIAAAPSQDPGVQRISLAQAEKARMRANLQASTRAQPSLP